jgi:hypothetical protein
VANITRANSQKNIISEDTVVSYKNTVLSEILRHLSDCKWHSFFSIHDRFRLSPLDIMDCIEDLLEKKVVERKGMEVKLIPINNVNTLSEMRKAFLNNYVLDCKNSDWVTEPALEINQFSLPKMELLANELVAKKGNNS